MQSSAENIWNSAQELLRSMLNADIFNLWFAPIRVRALQEDLLTLEVANDFCEVWLKDNYLGLIRDVLAQASGEQLRVKFIIGNTGPSEKPVVAPANPTEPARALGEESEWVEKSASNREFGFNPKNTFDNFVVGSNNTFAHAAAMAVAQAPGKAYNPLFLYGGVGLGKTHLLHAIGQYVASHKK